MKPSPSAPSKKASSLPSPPRAGHAHCRRRSGSFNGLQPIATNALNIPVIVISGFDDVVLQAEARAMGADYLVKPVSPSALLERIKQKLAAPRSPAPPERPVL